MTYALSALKTACVMNFITHAAAFSLYPMSTFSDRRSLVLARLSPEESSAAKKYSQRGWRIDRFLRVEEFFDGPYELGVQQRRIGDALCWSFELDSGIRTDECTSTHSHCVWSLEYSTRTFEIELDDNNEWRVDDVFTGRILIHDDRLLDPID